MNEHEPYLSDLPLYLTGDLAPHVEDAVEAHLAGCAPCRRELAALGVTLQMIGQVGGESAVEALEVAAGRRRAGRLALRAAALVVAFVAGLAVRGGPDAPVPASPPVTKAPAAADIRVAEAPQTSFGRAALLFRAAGR